MDHSGRFKPWYKPGEISSPDLIRECGIRLTDRGLWTMFHDRFQRALFSFLLRSLKFHSRRDDVIELVTDLVQDVYMRLIEHKGEKLRTFRGETDASVSAFLARVSAGVVADHLRYENRGRTIGGNVISLQEARHREAAEVSKLQRSDLDMESVISWIDIERVIAADPDHKHAERNALIFKLYYIDGLTAGEIARYPGFDITDKGVEAVLVRTRKRIKQ